MPCPYGIDIPTIFEHYNKCVNEGNVAIDKQDTNYARARRAYLVSYGRKVPRERQADHCIGCKKCIDLCPQHINIPKKMRQIDEYIEKLRREG
jgi:predicted aldo/keto reductase-like oxidoreductase